MSGVDERAREAYDSYTAKETERQGGLPYVPYFSEIVQILDAASLTIIDTTELDRLRTIERLVREATWSSSGYVANFGDAVEALRVAVGSE
jgi:hypothetical protein